MIKKLFSSKIVKLTTSILSGILCIGCLSSNNADAMGIKIHRKTNSPNKIEKRKEATKPNKAEADTKRIKFNSLNHICVGKLEKNQYGHVTYETGGHLYKYKTFDKDYLKDRYTVEAVKMHLRRKTYFAKHVSEDMIRLMVNVAIHNLKNKRANIGQYYFAVDVGNGESLGSEGEKYLQVNLQYDVKTKKFYCASAYPVKEIPEGKTLNEF